MRHWRTKSCVVLLAAAGAVALAAAARADDRVRTGAGIGYDGQIVGVAEAGLVIKVAGSDRTVPFADIKEIASSAFPDLKRAEAAFARGVGGEPAAFAEAGRLYQGLLRRNAPPWLRVVVQWRMYGLYVESGRVREAVDAYLEMARLSPGLVADLKLPSPAEDDHEANKTMLAKVERTLRTAEGKPYADALRNFRVALLLLEGEPQDVLPLLDPLLASKDANVRETAMMRKLELLLATGDAAGASEWLEKVEAAVRDEAKPEMAYWRGRVLEAKGEHVAAALEYMRLAILNPAKNRNRTAEALWRSGKALEAVQAPRQEVEAVYNEAVKQYAGTPGAERARRALARLGAK